MQGSGNSAALLGYPTASIDPNDPNGGVSGQHLIVLPLHRLLIADGVAAESQHPDRQALAALSPRVLADLRATVTAPDLSSLGRQPSARQLRKPHKARVLLALLPKVPLFVQSVRRKIFFVVCRAI